MSRLALFLGLAVLVTSCSKEAPPPNRKAGTPSGEPSASPVVVLKVDGMLRGEGGKT